jgi:hypothetical protein
VALLAALATIVADEIALDRRHVQTDSIVTAANWSRTGGIARVKFTSARVGSSEATIQYGPFSQLPGVGDRVAIEYDPDKPARARAGQRRTRDPGRQRRASARLLTRLLIGLTWLAAHTATLTSADIRKSTLEAKGSFDVRIAKRRRG